MSRFACSQDVFWLSSMSSITQSQLATLILVYLRACWLEYDNDDPNSPFYEAIRQLEYDGLIFCKQRECWLMRKPI